MKRPVAVDTSRVSESIEQPDESRQNDRQGELREDAVRPAASELNPRHAGRKHQDVHVGDVGGDHQGRSAEAGASIQTGGAARGADQRVTDVIHELCRSPLAVPRL